MRRIVVENLQRGQPHVTIEGGGHFLQEDRGPELAELLIGFIGS